MAISDIARPPGAEVTPFSELSGMDSMMPAAPGPGDMEGGQKAAVAYLETAVEMLDAAGDEAPELMEAIQAIKEFMGQTLAQAMGIGQPTQEPIQPPADMGMGGGGY